MSTDKINYDKQINEVINNPIEHRIIAIQKFIYETGIKINYDDGSVYDEFTMSMLEALKPVFKKYGTTHEQIL